MLPTPALGCILEHLEDTRMGYYIKLAQINRVTRRFFLSDYAWAKFDVHDVRGRRTEYRYEDYKLVGVAAHYYNWLCSLSTEHRAWHMLSAPPCWMYSAELYDQMNCIGRLSEASIHLENSAPPRGFFAQIHVTVWELWITHPHHCIWRIWPSELEPLLRDRRIVLSLIAHLPSHDGRLHVARKFMNDRAIIMELLVRAPLGFRSWKRDWKYECQRDAEFIEEAVWRNPMAIYSWRSDPKIVSKLVLRFPTQVRLFLNEYPTMIREFFKFMPAWLICECIIGNVRLMIIAEEVLDNDCYVHKLMEHNAQLGYLCATPRLQFRRDIARTAFSLDPSLLRVMFTFQRDKNFVLECLQTDPSLIRYATRKVQRYIRMRSWFLEHWPGASQKERKHTRRILSSLRC